MQSRDGGNRRNHCEPVGAAQPATRTRGVSPELPAPTVGAAGSAALQQHGPMGLTPNVSRLTPKETICRRQMLLNVKPAGREGRAWGPSLRRWGRGGCVPSIGRGLRYRTRRFRRTPLFPAVLQRRCRGLPEASPSRPSVTFTVKRQMQPHLF